MDIPFGYRTNPVVLQDLLAELNGKFEHTGDLLWPPQRQIYENVAKYCEDGPIADIGCGLGIGTQLLRRCFVQGFDISEKHVRFASLLFPETEYKVHDITRGPLPRTFHTVVAIDIIEHVEAIEEAVKHLLHSARSRLYISTPNKSHPSMGKVRPHNGHHVREYTPAEMLTLFPGAMIRHPVTWAELPETTTVTPLVYEVTK